MNTPQRNIGLNRIRLALFVWAVLSLPAAAQIPFAESADTVSHRVIQTPESLQSKLLSSFIQGQVQRRLEQHIRTGRGIDHRRLSEIIEKLPISEAAREQISEFAQAIDSGSLRRRSVPPDIERSVDQGVRDYLEEASRRTGLFPSPENWLAGSDQDSGRTSYSDEPAIEDSGSKNRDLGGLNRRSMPPKNALSAARRQSKPHAQYTSGDDDGLTRKILESTFDAIDRSSMEFLKNAQNDGAQLDLSWLQSSTRRWNRRFSSVQRTLESVSTKVIAKNQASRSSNQWQPQGGSSNLGVIVFALGILGVLWVSYRFVRLDEQTDDLESQSTTSATINIDAITDRTSLVRAVNSAATRLLGREAAKLHHEQLFSNLRRVDPAIDQICSDYVKARYAPQSFRLDHDSIHRVRTILARLLEVAAQGIPESQHERSQLPYAR